MPNRIWPPRRIMSLRVRSSLPVWSFGRDDNRLGLSLRIFSRPFRSMRHGGGRSYERPARPDAMVVVIGASNRATGMRGGASCSRRVLVLLSAQGCFETVDLCKRSILRMGLTMDYCSRLGSFRSIGFQRVMCRLRK